MDEYPEHLTQEQRFVMDYLLGKTGTIDLPNGASMSGKPKDKSDKISDIEKLKFFTVFLKKSLIRQ